MSYYDAVPGCCDDDCWQHFDVSRGHNVAGSSLHLCLYDLSFCDVRKLIHAGHLLVFLHRRR